MTKPPGEQPVIGQVSAWWRRGSRRGKLAGVLGAVLIAGGGSAVGAAVASQGHAPQPGTSQAGGLGKSAPAPPSGHSSGTSTSGDALVLARSLPVRIDIPAIDVHSKLRLVGLNRNGTLQVPPLNDGAITNEAAWYKYSPTPGEVGPSIIEGHIDSAADGPSVFYRLGALRPGDRIEVTLKDGVVATFRVDGAREYLKSGFPTKTVYGGIRYPGLRLITCGGNFDFSTGHYLSNVVVFASLVSAHRSALAS